MEYLRCMNVQNSSLDTIFCISDVACLQPKFDITHRRHHHVSSLLSGMCAVP